MTKIFFTKYSTPVEVRVLCAAPAATRIIKSFELTIMIVSIICINFKINILASTHLFMRGVWTPQFGK